MRHVGLRFENSKGKFGRCGIVLLCFSAIWLSAFSAGFAEESLSLDQRVLRMEEEVRTLQQRNEQLQQEILQLRRQMEEAEVEIIPEPEASALPPAPPVTEVDVAPQFDVGYKNGFFITSDDGQFSLRLGGRITGRLTAFDSDYALDDQFSVRRARLETDATLLDYYSLRVQVEFADASRPTDSYSTRLKDGYLDIHYFPEARLRFGQFKVPFSWEALQSHKYLDFADLSLAVNNMRGGRDIGMMVHGQYRDKFLQYQLALINGSGENRGDNNSAMDIVARVALLPFLDFDTELFSPLLLGLSGTYGDQNTDLSTSSFRTIAGTEFVDFSSGTLLRGDRSRLGTEFIWPIGPASVKSEFMWMSFEDLQNAGIEEDVDFKGWYLSGTYLLTGEKKTLGRVIPLKPFDPFKRTWGAWEVAARYSIFESEDDLFDLGLATGTDRAEAYTIGLNWYLNPFMRVIVDYEHTDFEDDFLFSNKTVRDEDALFVQWQLEF